MTRQPFGSRRELSAVLAVTLLGGVLRSWRFGRLGLSHFDEGVYALSGLWVLNTRGLSGLDPGVVPYAPPGFPVLVGLAYGLFGVSDLAALSVSVLLGIATIPVVAWLAARTFGKGAGAAAAIFASFSLAQIAFSRKALTDVPFLFFWLVGIGLGMRFLMRPRPGRALMLGLAVGVAQLFKYNGWLLGAIVILTALLAPIARPEERRLPRLVATFGWGLLAAGIAALIYWPWFRFVETHGGYLPLLEHQKSYAGGLADWWPHWNQHLGQVVALSGGPVWVASTCVVAWLASVWALHGFAPPRPGMKPSLSRLDLTTIAVALLLLPLPTLPWWIGLVWLPWLVRSEQPAWRLLGSSWLLLSILTPIYHPYARLWLPLHATGWLLMSGLVVEFAPRTLAPEEDTPLDLPRCRPHGWIRPGALGTCLLLGWLQVYCTRPRPLPASWVLDPSPSLREFAAVRLNQALVENADRRREIRVRVLARRPLAFYLYFEKRITFQLEAGLKPSPVPSRPDEWLVWDEAVLGTDPTVPLASLRTCWRWESTYLERLDPVTLLDVRPEMVYQPLPDRGNAIWLFAASKQP